MSRAPSASKYLKALTDDDSRMFDRFRETDWFKAALSELAQN